MTDAELFDFLSHCQIEGIDARDYLNKQIHRLARTLYRLDLVKVGEFWFEWRGSRPVEIFL